MLWCALRFACYHCCNTALVDHMHTMPVPAFLMGSSNIQRIWDPAGVQQHTFTTSRPTIEPCSHLKLIVPDF
jgi:hypothetical protein